MSDQQEDMANGIASALPATETAKFGILNKLFSSCTPDPRGSVHRAWGISLLFVVVYFALSIFESKSRNVEKSPAQKKRPVDAIFEARRKR